jgi:hypothetical protein
MFPRFRHKGVLYPSSIEGMARFFRPCHGHCLPFCPTIPGFLPKRLHSVGGDPVAFFEHPIERGIVIEAPAEVETPEGEDGRRLFEALKRSHPISQETRTHRVLLDSFFSAGGEIETPVS